MTSGEPGAPSNTQGGAACLDARSRGVSTLGCRQPPASIALCLWETISCCLSRQEAQPWARNHRESGECRLKPGSVRPHKREETNAIHKRQKTRRLAKYVLASRPTQGRRGAYCRRECARSFWSCAGSVCSTANRRPSWKSLSGTPSMKSETRIGVPSMTVTS